MWDFFTCVINVEFILIAFYIVGKLYGSCEMCLNEKNCAMTRYIDGISSHSACLVPTTCYLGGKNGVPEILT